MVRRPDASDTLVDTPHRLAEPLVLLARRVPQQLDLLLYLVRVHVLHADRPRVAVDVVCADDGVLGRPWGDGHLNLGVCGGESGEE